MKKILIILLLIGCDTAQKPFPVSHNETLDGIPFITGRINRQNLISYEHSKWFKDEYEKYRVPSGWVERNKGSLNEMSLKLFLGTWCEDSAREVPGIIKLLEFSEFNFKNIDL